ncbi:hypothetical protein SCUCBS95973_005570 [Sporothrix curviconia]|uniref:F-box domain containing protein n=1 Tax=Sporothrix curviconia TaxID=1260050 RepID=A0ABP0BZU4_9PEZI
MLPGTSESDATKQDARDKEDELAVGIGRHKKRKRDIHLDMHPFCRFNDASPEMDNEPRYCGRWQLLADFIGKLPCLTDVVWDAEYPDFNLEVIERMIAGLARNLTNVWLAPMTIDELPPPLLYGSSGDKLVKYIPMWLRIVFRVNERGTVEARLGSGAVQNLKIDIHLDSPAAFDKILLHASPLTEVCITGYFNQDSLDKLIGLHGPSLHTLSLDSSSYPFMFDEETAQKLVDGCPQLQDLSLEVRRTYGNKGEVAVYRALSRLPQLRRVVFRLRLVFEPPAADFRKSRPSVIKEYAKDVLANSLINGKLTRAIFEVMSGMERSSRGDTVDGDSIARMRTNKLEYLHISPRIHVTGERTRVHLIVLALSHTWKESPRHLNGQMGHKNKDNQILMDLAPGTDEHSCWEDWTSLPLDL